jgi:hypothetical protein
LTFFGINISETLHLVNWLIGYLVNSRIHMTN